MRIVYSWVLIFFSTGALTRPIWACSNCGSIAQTKTTVQKPSASCDPKGNCAKCARGEPCDGKQCTSGCCKGAGEHGGRCAGAQVSAGCGSQVGNRQGGCGAGCGSGAQTKGAGPTPEEVCVRESARLLFELSGGKPNTPMRLGVSKATVWKSIVVPVSLQAGQSQVTVVDRLPKGAELTPAQTDAGASSTSARKPTTITTTDGVFLLFTSPAMTGQASSQPLASCGTRMENPKSQTANRKSGCGSSTSSGCGYSRTDTRPTAAKQLAQPANATNGSCACSQKRTTDRTTTEPPRPAPTTFTYQAKLPDCDASALAPKIAGISVKASPTTLHVGKTNDVTLTVWTNVRTGTSKGCAFFIPKQAEGVQIEVAAPPRGFTPRQLAQGMLLRENEPKSRGAYRLRLRITPSHASTLEIPKLYQLMVSLPGLPWPSARIEGFNKVERTEQASAMFVGGLKFEARQ